MWHSKFHTSKLLDFSLFPTKTCSFSFQADKLLSQDFGLLMDRILVHLPEDRQLLLFSATFPVSIDTFKVYF